MCISFCGLQQFRWATTNKYYDGFCGEQLSCFSSEVVYAKSSQFQPIELRITRPSVSKKYNQESLSSSTILGCSGIVQSLCLRGFLPPMRYNPILGRISYIYESLVR